VLSVLNPETISVGVSALNWLWAWHEGGAGGPAGRVLLCLFAVVLALLPLTGLGMWVLRWRWRQCRQRASAAAGVAGARAGE
jgi:hypothetical protein